MAPTNVGVWYLSCALTIIIYMLQKHFRDFCCALVHGTLSCPSSSVIAPYRCVNCHLVWLLWQGSADSTVCRIDIWACLRHTVLRSMYEAWKRIASMKYETLLITRNLTVTCMIFVFLSFFLSFLKCMRSTMIYLWMFGHWGGIFKKTYYFMRKWDLLTNSTIDAVLTISVNFKLFPTQFWFLSTVESMFSIDLARCRRLATLKCMLRG